MCYMGAPPPEEGAFGEGVMWSHASIIVATCLIVRLITVKIVKHCTALICVMLCF